VAGADAPVLLEKRLSFTGQSLHESHEDDAPQTSDLVDITPFLWAVAHNLGGFQSTVIQQVGESLLPLVGELRL